MKEEKNLVEVTLDATRSALAAEQKKFQSTETANTTLKEEISHLNEQLKRLDGVKIANQKLLQQTKTYEDKIENLKQSLANKEKVV